MVEWPDRIKTVSRRGEDLLGSGHLERSGWSAELLTSPTSPADTKIDGQHDFPSDWALLEARIRHRHPRVVVFLDGDQALDQVKRLLWLLPDPVVLAEADWEVHLLVTAGRQTKLPRWWPIGASWCSWVRAHSRRKESADLVLSLEVDRLHASLLHDTRFVVASEDRFAASLAELFGGWGRICRALSRPWPVLDLGDVSGSQYHLALSRCLAAQEVVRARPMG